MTAPQYERLPLELKDKAQWCIAAPDKSPFTIQGFRASVTDAEHYTDFDTASTVAAQWGAGSGIGFVLCEGDGLVCIDLDVKDADNEPDSSKWTTPEQLARYERIIEAFDSYTERSRSGKGWHIFVRGVTGPGARFDGVEVYSQERFIICTGNVTNDKAVEARQEWLDLLVKEIRQGQGGGGAGAGSRFTLVEALETESDHTVYTRAMEAANGAKFAQLWQGQWQGEAEYPSQSEADLSLLSMLTFYSKSNEQVRRLFRMCALGQRAKATKNDKYLNRTLVLIRARQDREQKFDAVASVAAIKLVERMAVTKPTLLPVTPKPTLEWPPGAMGAIAQYLYRIAPRPVREVAIVTALGMYAGFFGRHYNISKSGLNLYLVLVARSGVGKEAIHSGLSRLANAGMMGGSPGIAAHIDFSDYASGPALMRGITDRQCFVNIAGEWGRKLRKMGEDDPSGPMTTLRDQLTALYQKSGVGMIVGGINYSDKDKNVKSTDGVAYSMIGETTPANFYESLTNTMMQDGFMSRFVVVEYTGNRPELNGDMSEPPPPWFIQMTADLFTKTSMMMPGASVEVQCCDEAAAMLKAFDKECDRQINGTNDEPWRQMWNRAHLKSLKISGLLACADNYLDPVVQVEHAQWALELVKRDISIMSRKMAHGDVGSGDTVKERKVLSMLTEYVRDPIPDGYKMPDAMRVAGVVSRRYLQSRLQGVNAFENGRNGRTKELDLTIKNLCDSGYLMEVARDAIPLDWGSVGRCFRILTLPEMM